MRIAAVTCIVAVVAAGCAQPTLSSASGANAAAALRFDGLAFQVTTTPDEANEPSGSMQVSWTPSSFLVQADHEDGMARRTIADGAQVSTSMLGLGWTRHDWSEEQTGRLSNRLQLWNLRSLLADPGLHARAAPQADGSVNWTWSGTLQGGALEVEGWLRSVAGVPVSAWLTSPQGRESPYRFVPGKALSFTPPALPIRESDEVDRLDAKGLDGHDQIVALLRDYGSHHAGMVPDTVDASSLQVELLAAGQSWPVNPYDGQGIAQRFASGELAWTKCGATDGKYQGYGWDSILVVDTFGKGCA